MSTNEVPTDSSRSLESTIADLNDNSLLIGPLHTDETPVYGERTALILHLHWAYPHIFEDTLMENHISILANPESTLRLAHYDPQSRFLAVSFTERGSTTPDGVILFTPDLVATVRDNLHPYDYVPGEAPNMKEVPLPVQASDGSVFVFTEKPRVTDSQIPVATGILARPGKSPERYSLTPLVVSQADWNQVLEEHVQIVSAGNQEKERRALLRKKDLERTMAILQEIAQEETESSEDTTREAVFKLAEALTTPYLYTEADRARRKERERRYPDKSYTQGLADILKESYSVEKITDVRVAHGTEVFRPTGPMLGAGATAVILEGENTVTGKRVALKFAFATNRYKLDLVQSGCDLEPPKDRSNARTVFLPPLDDERMNWERILQYETTGPNQATDSARFQQETYVPLEIRAPEVRPSSLESPVPCLILEDLSEETAASFKVLRNKLIAVLTAEEAGLNEKGIAFKMLSYLHGYFIDAYLHTLRRMTFDIQPGNLLLVPQKDHARLIDLGFTQQQHEQVAWKAYRALMAGDILEFSPYISDEIKAIWAQNKRTLDIVRLTLPTVDSWVPIETALGTMKDRLRQEQGAISIDMSDPDAPKMHFHLSIARELLDFDRTDITEGISSDMQKKRGAALAMAK